MSTEQLYDVVAVNIKTKCVRLMSECAKTKPNAEAIVKMAVYRLGVEEDFYCLANPGAYADGDLWEGSKLP